jgi:hypothetical protein
MVLAYLEAHRRQVRKADLRIVAFVLVHSVQSVVNASVLGRRLPRDVDPIAGELTTLVLRYLEPNRGGAAARPRAPAATGRRRRGY